MSLRSKITAKNKLLDEIIQDLETLKSKGTFENVYAIDENIKFFKSMYSLLRYVHWLKNEKPKIDGSRLLELSDFYLSSGRWESILQKELLEIEQWKFPDNLMQFRKTILTRIDALSQKNPSRPLILISLGSGPMEIERQLIGALRKNGSKQKLIMFGIDSAEASLNAAKENHQKSNMPIIETDNLNDNFLDKIKEEHKNEQFILILLKANVMLLKNYFKEGSVDLVYHSKFKHHLIGEQKLKLDEICKYLSKVVIETDLLNNMFMMIVPVVARTRWLHPILLNGGIFSALRSPLKQEVLSEVKNGWQVKIFPDGYIKTYYAD